MKEHKRIIQKKQEALNPEHRLGNQESQPLPDSFHAWEQGSFTDTPFRPPIGEHAASLAQAKSDSQRANLVLQLQQTYGNAYVQRLLKSTAVQAKLTVSQPDDAYEREADRVAQQVMTMTVPANAGHTEQPDEVSSTSQAQPVLEGLQRQTIDDNEQILQARPLAASITPVVQPQAGGSPEIAGDLESRLAASKGGGTPLPEDVRGYMEPRFGASFSGVRLHTDREAAQMNRELNAQAFTHGRDIYVGEGMYNPGSDAGKRLLAHELTHVVQQSGPMVEATRPAFGWARRTRQMANRDYAHGSQSVSSRSEAAFDAKDKDKTKTETNITWKPPTYTHQAASPAHNGQVKAQDVTWPTATYSSDNSNGSSTCVEVPFTVSYKEIDDEAAKAWKLGISSITGGATITVHTGGSQNPIDNPPTSEAQAKDAVKVMKGYYKRGSRGSWHTEDASKDHELYHYREWKESCDHYWPTCRTAIENLQVSKATKPSKGPAVADLKKQADSKVNGFKAKAREYWFTLGDGASDRPYAAGQLTLNTAIKSVQNLAKEKKWEVEKGTDSPSTDNPCYQPWLPYNP